MRRKIFKIIKWLAIVILILCCMGITWNYFCKRREIPKIQAAYGKAVKVNGKKMTVEIAGLQAEESPVIVLLPGLGSPSPVLEFRPLAEKLGKTYKVITVEPFGYGLSDPADTERSIENIVEELHACLEEIGVHRYYLMAHSISGLYSLYYANTYPEEVRGFIGIDSSVPKQNENEPFDTTKLNLLMAYLSKTKNVLGISRIFSIGNPEKAIYADQNYSYSQEDLEVFRILSLDNSYNKTVMNELKQVEKNLEIVQDMKFPEEVPVLNFVSEDNCEIFPEWEKLHRSVLSDNQENRLVMLKGGHYLHFEQKERINYYVVKFIN